MLKTYGIAEYKALVNCDKIDIVRNPKTDKLFGACSNGETIKVEQAIDFKKVMVVLVDVKDDGTFDACLINQRPDNVQITL